MWLREAFYFCCSRGVQFYSNRLSLYDQIAEDSHDIEAGDIHIIIYHQPTGGNMKGCDTSRA